MGERTLRELHEDAERAVKTFREGCRILVKAGKADDSDAVVAFAMLSRPMFRDALRLVNHVIDLGVLDTRVDGD